MSSREKRTTSGSRNCKFGTDSQSNTNGHTVKHKNSTRQNSINDILDQLALRQQRGETSLIISIEPELIEDVMNMPGYTKSFAPVIPGLTHTEPIYAAYQQMRQASETTYTILVLVECETIEEFREALGRMPLRKSSDWRSFSTA